MKTLLKVFAICSMARASLSYAVIVLPFPGLEEAVKQADVVAIIRIDGHIQIEPGPDLMSKHQCIIYQCLKGDLKPGQVVPMSLYDMELVSPFSRGSVHLVFLQKQNDSYWTCRFTNPTVRLSPLGNEKYPDGKTIQEKIHILLQHSLQYWDGEWKKERGLMEKISK